MELYTVVFVGYPNWWGTIPMPIAAFLSEYDFSGKTIVRFARTREASWAKCYGYNQALPQSTFWMVLQSVVRRKKCAE